MKNLETYIEELIMQIDEAETEDEAQQLVDRFTRLSEALQAYRTLMPTSMPQELMNALDADLEHYEGMAALASKRAEDTIEEIAQQAEDDAEYGSYEAQVRDTYNRGVL